MTERSRPWDGTTVGDAVEAAYDAPTEFARLLRAVTFNAEISSHKSVVVDGAFGYGDLAASTPSANVARIAGGLAIVQGTWYENDNNVDVTIATPATSTRVDRIVLRKSWAAQTVRVTVIPGVEGAGPTSLTQNAGTTWDMPMWQASITTGGAITFTDERPKMHQHIHSGATSGGQISHASLTSVLADQHHTQFHQASHGSGQPDQLSHTALALSGTTTHAIIDTHIAAQLATASGQHGVVRLNTTGTQSLGSPVDGKIVYARGNGGTLTVTTPSGAILVGTVNAGGSFAIANGDSYTFISDGTNWIVF